MSVQVSITYQKKPLVVTARDVNLSVPETGLFVQIKHDYETIGYPRQRDWGIKYPIPAMMSKLPRPNHNVSQLAIKTRTAPLRNAGSAFCVPWLKVWL